MAPAWHKEAKRLRRRGASLSQIGSDLGVSPQAVSLALDPSKQEARRKYVKQWSAEKYGTDPQFRKHKQKLNRESKRRRRTDPKRVTSLREYEREESRRRYKDPKYRKAQQKRARSG